MSVIAVAVRHLLAAGVTGEALVAAIADMEASTPQVVTSAPVVADDAAERRREADRERKRNVRGSVRTYKKSADIAPMSADIADILPLDGPQRDKLKPPFIPLTGDDVAAPSAIELPESEPQPKPAKAARETVELPGWLPLPEWAAFVAHRRAAKAPFTVEAARQIILKLDKLRSETEPPGDILNQSIRKGWLDVFQLKVDQNERSSLPAANRQSDRPARRDPAVAAGGGIVARAMQAEAERIARAGAGGG